MQLIYLWVGHFRNIDDKEFHFSPQFKVKFVSDKYGTQLSILQQKQSSIFDGKIKNVSVLIGKNGSGKSNILDLLGHRIKERKKLHRPQDKYFLMYHYSRDVFVIEGRDFSVIKALVDNYPDSPNGFPVVSEPYSMKVELKKNGRLQFLEFLQFDSKHDAVHIFNIRNTFSTDYDLMSFEADSEGSLFFNRWNINPKRIGDYAKYKLLIDFQQPQGENAKRSLFYGLDEVKLIIRNAVNQVHEEIEMQYRYSSVHFYSDNNQNKEPPIEVKRAFLFKLMQDNLDALLHDLRDGEPKIKNSKVHYDRTLKSLRDLPYVPGEERAYLLTALKIAFDCMKKKYKSLDTDPFYKAFEKLVSLLDSLNTRWFTSTETIEVDVNTKELSQVTNLLKYIDSCKFNDDGMNYLSGCIEVSIKPLSSGEETFLNLFASVYFALSLHAHSSKDHALLLLDEPDQNMHPEWSRRILFELFQLLNIPGEYRSYQLIVSTHSPFIVSDVPKSCVTALTKDDNGYCSIQSFGETFGSNIHTLLTEDFFMDATIGEFALHKINQIIRQLQGDVALTTEDFRRLEEVILNVGEPILRSKLIQMIYDKDPELKRKRITAQLEELHSELRRLEDEQ